MPNNGLNRANVLARQRAARARENAKPTTPTDRENQQAADRLEPRFPYTAIPFPADVFLK